MKVLVLPSAYPDSYNPARGRFFGDHALALRQAGHDVVVLAVVFVSLKTVWRRRKLRFGFSTIDDAGVPTYQYELPSIPKVQWLNNAIRTWLGLRLYRSILLDREPPDIIHVHSYLAGAIAVKIKRKYGIPYVVTEHSSTFARALLSRSQRKLASRVFREAAARSAVSRAFVDHLTRRFGVSFLFTPNPVDISVEELGKKGSSERVDARRAIRICTVAFLDRNKRIDRLIRAFRSLLKDFPDAELHVGGDGVERPNLEVLVQKLDIASRVFFHGILDRGGVSQLINRCDLLAVSSDYETFGVVLIEAMARGLPVVATRCGGPESIVTATWIGELTQREDEDFERGLRTVVRGVVSGRYESEAISKHARETYSYDAIGKRMNQLYQVAMADSPMTEERVL